MFRLVTWTLTGSRVLSRHNERVGTGGVENSDLER